MLGNNRSLDMAIHVLAHAVLQNPRGRVNIWDQAEFFGKMKAARLNGGGKIHVDLDADFD
jgi:hypothetical protein